MALVTLVRLVLICHQQALYTVASMTMDIVVAHGNIYCWQLDSVISTVKFVPI